MTITQLIGAGCESGWAILSDPSFIAAGVILSGVSAALGATAMFLVCRRHLDHGFEHIVYVNRARNGLSWDDLWTAFGWKRSARQRKARSLRWNRERAANRINDPPPEGSN